MGATCFYTCGTTNKKSSLEMDLAQDWYNPRICKGWQEDGWYCGTMGTTPDIHYGGFDWDCIQCGRGWVERGWFCGCCWQHEGQRVEQEQTRKKFNLAPIPKEHTQQRKPEFEVKNPFLASYLSGKKLPSSKCCSEFHGV
jgi:hypothetical protein